MLKKKLSAEQKRIIFLSSLGGMLEFYDFTIYGLFAVYFSTQFFPSENKLITIIASYSVFLIGYVARPLGGIIFSHIGDEVGRKKVIILTMVLMGLASLGLGLLPTYATIGAWAPLAMLSLRLLQGLAIGGELPSMIVYIAESMPEQRGIAMGGVFAGTVGGMLPGMLINLLITHCFTASQIHSFGWRIPFILGSLLCFVSYQIRSKLHETTVFMELQQHKKFPLASLIKHHFPNVCIGVGLISMMATPILLAIIFMPTYLTSILKFNSSVVSSAVLTATIISILSTYFMGLLTVRFRVSTLMQAGCFLLITAAGICYWMIAWGGNLTVALSFFTLFQGALVSLPPILLSDLFPVEVRLSGVALSYNIAFVLFGALTPIAVTTLIQYTHLVYLVPFFYLALIVIVGLFSLSKCKLLLKRKC